MGDLDGILRRISALGKGVVRKWGRTDLTGIYLLDPARVRPVPSETHDFKGFQPDFNRTLTGF